MTWAPEDMALADGLGAPSRETFELSLVRPPYWASVLGGLVAPDPVEEAARLLRDRRAGDLEVLETVDPILEG